jgi:hypothetical protein
MHVEGVGQKSGPSTATFNDLLCFTSTDGRDRTVSSPASYWENPVLKPEPEDHRPISWLRLFVASLSPSRKTLGYKLIKPWRLPSASFSVHYSLIVLASHSLDSSQSSQPICSWPILIISFYLSLDLSSGVFRSGFPTLCLQPSAQLPCWGCMPSQLPATAYSICLFRS